MSQFEEMSDEEIRQMVSDEFGEDFRSEADEVSAELLSESPRASVLVGAAWLDQYLVEFLSTVLPQDDRIAEVFLSPIRYLGHRIESAHKLGIIGSSEKEAMMAVKDIRNKFAHRTSVSFVDPDIVQLASKLDSFLPPKYTPSSKPGDATHAKYVSAIAHQVASLHTRIKHTKLFPAIDTRLEYLRFVTERVDEEGIP